MSTYTETFISIFGQDNFYENEGQLLYNICVENKEVNSYIDVVNALIENDPNIDNEDEAFTSLSEDDKLHIITVIYNKVSNIIKQLPEPMILYRAIGSEGRSYEEAMYELMQSQNFGNYWSYDKKLARSYWGPMGTNLDIVLTAEVSKNDINTIETYFNNAFNGMYEKEININSNAIIHLINMELINTQTKEVETHLIDFTVKATAIDWSKIKYSSDLLNKHVNNF